MAHSRSWGRIGVAVTPQPQSPTSRICLPAKVGAKVCWKWWRNGLAVSLKPSVIG